MGIISGAITGFKALKNLVLPAKNAVKYGSKSKIWKGKTVFAGKGALEVGKKGKYVPSSVASPWRATTSAFAQTGKGKNSIGLFGRLGNGTRAGIAQTRHNWGQLKDPVRRLARNTAIGTGIGFGANAVLRGGGNARAQAYQQQGGYNPYYYG